MEEQIIDIQKQQMGTGMSPWMIVFWIAVYVVFAYCLAILAKKMGRPFKESFIWAIIPIANIFLILKLAEKPMWWFVLLLIPIVNIVMSIIIWMAICEKRGKPGWWGIIIGLVPFVNVIFYLMLVFSEGKQQPVSA